MTNKMSEDIHDLLSKMMEQDIIRITYEPRAENPEVEVWFKTGDRGRYRETYDTDGNHTGTFSEYPEEDVSQSKTEAIEG